MKKTPQVGNRINKRFPVLSSRVQLRRISIMNLFGKETHQLSLIDLSTSGIQAISSIALNEGKKYEIAIRVPAFSNPIWANGRVVWHKPHTTNDQQQYYRVGLEFTYFKGQTLQKIKHLEHNPKLREIY